LDNKLARTVLKTLRSRDGRKFIEFEVANGGLHSFISYEWVEVSDDAYIFYPEGGYWRAGDPRSGIYETLNACEKTARHEIRLLHEDSVYECESWPEPWKENG
jgi:hypothetical protein